MTDLDEVAELMADTAGGTAEQRARTKRTTRRLFRIGWFGIGFGAAGVAAGIAWSTFSQRIAGLEAQVAAQTAILTGRVEPLALRLTEREKADAVVATRLDICCPLVDPNRGRLAPPRRAAEAEP